MPVVQTDQLYFDGPFKRQVKFTKKDGFTCELPLASLEILGVQTVGADTLKGCLAQWDLAIKKWKSAATSTREVLIYQLHRKACITRREKDDSERGWGTAECIFKADDMHFERGIGLAVCAGVFTEIKITMGSDARYEYKQIRGRLPASLEDDAGGHSGIVGRAYGDRIVSAIDTTPELEAFFTNIGSGLEKLILMFEQLQEQDKLIAYAASGARLLGPGTADPQESIDPPDPSLISLPEDS